MIDDALTVPAGRRLVWWPTLRLVLVLLWVVAAALSWWTAPRKTDYEHARRAVAAGRVVAYRWGDHFDGGSNRWFGAPRLVSDAKLGPMFEWRTSDGRVHWTDTGEVPQTGPVDPTYAGPGAEVIGAQLTGRQPDDRLGPADPAINAIGLVLAVVFASALLAGPAPVRGTKWYWWWVGVLMPYGLGLLFWMGRDRPWVSVGERVPRGVGAAHRNGGWAGLVTGFVASLVISGLIWALSRLVGTTWVPFRNA